MGTIAGFSPFFGEHCETTATGNLLAAAGLRLSEPMLYGLGQGLAFGVFTFASMPAPFIGGRPKPEMLTSTLAARLDVAVDYRQTRSAAKAWAHVADFVDAGQPVGVKLNCRYLDYFSSAVDFAGHYVTVYGYDDERVFVVDTNQQGGVLSTRRESFEQGRLWKGPMSSNALTWTVAATTPDIDWPRILVTAITTNAKEYLSPPIKNFGPPGIRKTAALVRTWPKRYQAADIAQVGMLMERGGTGGGLFRNFYRDFLIEANGHLQVPEIAAAVPLFDRSAQLWSRIAEHLIGTGTDRDDDAAAAANLLRQVADLEEQAMTPLAALSLG